jgi:hypothetical protein
VLSIENLYWILYEHLLKPAGLDCWYYYPFGTQNFLSRTEFQSPRPKREHHALFHYDQEPIWSTSLGSAYDLDQTACSYKLARILANSEHSELKKKVCLERGMLDWYYFFHGFAALDWYRDAQYLRSDFVVQKPFLLLNHLFRDHRSYRIALLARLVQKNVAHLGAVSFHGTWSDCKAEIDCTHSLLSGKDKMLIEDCASELQSLPWTIDTEYPNGDLSARFGHQELGLWQQALFHIVTETVFYQYKKHLTEKIFKPIVSRRPFILVGAPGNLAYLRSYGFKTFSSWINESYDDVEDSEQRLDMISDEIHRIANLSTFDLIQMEQEMLPTLEHNKRHFFGSFRQIIVNEMVDNFDRCIRQWNNGRIDDRTLSLVPDLDLVKSILSR